MSFKPTERVRPAGLFVLSVAAILVFAGGTAALRQAYTSRSPGGNDLLPRWVAARAWLMEGLSPYDPAIELRGQTLIYGRPAAAPGEDRARFLYLPHALLIVAPVAWLPYDWAHAAWMLTMIACLAAISIGSMRLYHWQPPAWLVGAIVLWSVVVYPGARSVILGQIAPIMGLLVTLSLLAIDRRRDGLAGVLLALSTAKPTLSILVAPLLFGWSLYARRWRLSISIAASLAAVALFGYVVDPAWPVQVLRQSQEYSGYAPVGSVVQFMVQALLPAWLHQTGEAAGLAVPAAWLVGAWLRVRHGEAADFNRAAAITMLVTVVALPVNGTTSQPALYMIVIMLFAEFERMATGGLSLPARRALIALILMLSVIVLWWVFLTSVQGRLEQPPVYLPLPVGLAVALLLTGPWRRERQVLHP
jgi:hypothetical protein